MEKVRKGLADLYSRVFRNWKTTLAGLYVGASTLLIILGKIDVNEFLALLGGIGTIIALFAKDE
jgi:hypothetical protein